MSPEIQSVVGLVVGVAALIFLVVRTKVHVFPALLIAASIIELVGGRAPPDTVEANTEGSGNTLATIGLVVGHAVARRDTRLALGGPRGTCRGPPSLSYYLCASYSARLSPA
jgi:hypothetical protein